uniref:Uncharacterized protein n=1 Tax=Arundo donax TaxID=35708 RepID=A0A0A9H2K9_ARUDO
MVVVGSLRPSIGQALACLVDGGAIGSIICQLLYEPCCEEATKAYATCAELTTVVKAFMSRILSIISCIRLKIVSWLHNFCSGNQARHVNWHEFLYLMSIICKS